MNLKVTHLQIIQTKGDKRVTVDITKENLDSIVTNRKWMEHTSRRSYSLPRKETPAGKTRVYVSVKGESLWDDFENRTSRPHTLWAPHVKKALIDAGWPADVKLRWSQKAGCSCPCSPAFFVTGGKPGLDMWAVIEADTVQGDVAVALERHAALASDPTIPVS